MRIGTAGPARRRIVGLLGLLSLLSLVSAPADARPSGATIVIHLIAPVSDPMSPTATIAVTCVTDPNHTRSASLDGQHDVTLRNVPPGTCRVDVSLSAVASLAVDVEPGEVVDLVATFPPTGQTGPHLDVRNRWQRWQGVSFYGAALENLPASSNLWGIADATEPFLIADRIDDGGLLATRTALVGSRGASWTTTSLEVGAVDLGPPGRTGALPIVPSLLPFEAVTFVTGMIPADVSGPGPAITLVPREAGPSPAGSVAEDFTAGRMISTNDRNGPPSIARLDSLSNLAGEYGTPLGARAGLFASASSLRSSDTELGVSPALPANADSGAANVTMSASPNDRIHVDGAGDRVTRAYDGREQFADRDVAEHDGFARIGATWDHAGASGNMRSMALGFVRGASTPDVTPSMPGGVVDEVFDGPVPPPPTSDVTGRLTARLSMEPRDLVFGGAHHAIAFGLTFEHASSTSTVTALPTVGDMVDGLPARIWVPQPTIGPSERHDTDAAFTVTDDVRLAAHVTLSAGLRTELTRGAAAGAPRGISWATLTPRVSLHWSPAPITLYVAYSRYHPAFSLDWLAFGDPGESFSNVFLWNDTNSNGRVDPGETGALVARSGWGQVLGSIDPLLEAPTTDELTFGAERRVGAHLRLDASTTFRHESNLLASIDTGAPADDYTIATVLDQGEDFSSPADDRPLAIFNRTPASFGLDRYELVNAPDGTARYEGAEVSATLTTERLFLLVGAMAYLTRESGGSPGFGPLENDQGVIGARLEDPNAAPYEPGSSFFDRSYVLKWSAGYAAAHDLHVGVAARYEDGQPFSRLVIAPNLNQGPELVEAYRIGRTRFTFTLTLDAHIEKGFTFARRRLALTVDVFNLTNSALQVDENPVTGPDFRQTTAVQPPRTVRVGFSVKF